MRLNRLLRDQRQRQQGNVNNARLRRKSRRPLQSQNRLCRREGGRYKFNGGINYEEPDAVEIVASWGAASSAPTLAGALKWREGLRWRPGDRSSNGIQVVIDFPAVCSENVASLVVHGASVTEYTPAVARYVNGEIQKCEPISEG